MRTHKQTCYNSFSAISNATMPSYGAFFAELDSLQDANVKRRAAFENCAISADKFRRAQLRAPENKSETSSTTLYSIA